MATISVAVPPDAQPNQMMQVQTPTGQPIMVTIPPGTAPGSVIQVQYAPTAPAAMYMSREPIAIEADKNSYNPFRMLTRATYF
jgi:hypothetical protein